MNSHLALTMGHIGHLWLFEDISGDDIKVSQVFDGGDVLWDGLDHHLAGRQHQLVSSHLRQEQYEDLNPHIPGWVGRNTGREPQEDI